MNFVGSGESHQFQRRQGDISIVGSGNRVFLRNCRVNLKIVGSQCLIIAYDCQNNYWLTGTMITLEEHGAKGNVVQHVGTFIEYRFIPGAEVQQPVEPPREPDIVQALLQQNQVPLQFRPRVHKSQSVDECCICLRVKTGKYVSLLRCGHEPCLRCLGDLLSTSGDCPLCRVKIVP